MKTRSNFLNKCSSIEEAKRLIIYNKEKLEVIEFLKKHDEDLLREYNSGYFSSSEVLNVYLRNQEK